jgi:sec-independent protein translocase protein TatA
MVGLDNPLHLGFLLVILLLIFGAKRLPEMGRSLGSGLRGFRDSLSGEAHEEQVPDAKPELAEAVELPAMMHVSAQAQGAEELETHTVA